MTTDIVLDAYPTLPETTDPRIPPRRAVVVRDLIERWAHEIPEKVFVHFEDNDETWTYRQLRDNIVQTALGLQQIGVRQGDHVLVWLPNCRENLRVFLASNYLGAVYVPINTAYKGSLLAHVIDNADAEIAVVHADLVDRLNEVPLGKLRKLVVVGSPKAADRLETFRYCDVLLPRSGRLAAPPRPIEPWDPMSIIYTSGTTGPSKGVLASYLHIFTNAGPESWSMVTSEDRFMVNPPMFHLGGMGVIYVMLVRGASIAFADRFETSRFWESIRRTNCSVVFLLGVMASFLQKQEPRADDADNPLRMVFTVPLVNDVEAFSKRFDVDVYTIFNMTEISTPIVSGRNPTARGTCGKRRDGVEVRLVDENDCEVPAGQIGEMILRTDRPWGMNSGYYNNPQATAKAWRNGWFHTGDAFRVDGEGNYYFVDRLKDAIRRRGENISSFEVEADVTAFPAIKEAAAIGVPSELGEDDVMVCLAPVEGATVDPAELIAFLRSRMSHFMIPRYVRVLPELPKTPSAKVMKTQLRQEGVTADTWDREKAGIIVKSDRFAATSTVAGS